MRKTYLIIGNCGVGKTFIMQQLIHALTLTEVEKLGLYHLQHNFKFAVIGKYDNSMYQGSDRLAMNVMADNDKMLDRAEKFEFLIAEGDRFTNSTFIRDFQPTILRVNGTGEEGRKLRGSEQSERHIKSITTRVKNIQSDYEFDNSTECFEWLLKTMLEPDKNHYAKISKKFIKQESLF